MKKIIYSYSLTFVGIILLYSCTKDLEAINANKNDPVKVPATNLLVAGISNGFNQALTCVDFAYGGYGGRPSGFWCQHYAENNAGYKFIDWYQIARPSYEVYWKQFYSGPLIDLQGIIDNPDYGKNVKSAALVMSVYLFSILTDLFGDIPYTNALDVSQHLQPKYDAQEFIYKDMTEKLKVAAVTLKDSLNSDALGVGDILYQGDIFKWIKFANTLRARLLNRYRMKDNKAASDLSELLTHPSEYPVFESNDDNATLIPVGQNPYVNPFYYINLNLPNSLLPSYVFVKTLNDFKDPRLTFIFKPNAAGDYVGLENGKNGNGLSLYSNYTEYFFTNPKLEMTAISYAEILFIKAEVLNNKQDYDDGIIAALELFKLQSSPEFKIKTDSAYNENHLEAIMTQKWIALFLNENEAFTEFRRTSMPSFIQPAFGVLAPQKDQGIPHRYEYPPIEESTNGINLQEAQKRQNINNVLRNYGDKMWWAK